MENYIGKEIEHEYYGKGTIVSEEATRNGDIRYAVYFPRYGTVVGILNLKNNAMVKLLEDTKPADDANRPLKVKAPKEAKKAKVASNKEAVNHPDHYNTGKIEVIDFIEDKKLGFNLGNAVKYISRCQYKLDGSRRIEDLKKAKWYIERQISTWEKESPSVVLD